MRPIVAILMAMLLTGWIASRIELPKEDPPSPAAHIDWVRTIDGWEKRSRWDDRNRHHAPAVHPLVVGALQLMISLASLISFSSQRPRHLSPLENTAILATPTAS